jgi:hypothetical protein
MEVKAASGVQQGPVHRTRLGGKANGFMVPAAHKTGHEHPNSIPKLSAERM